MQVGDASNQVSLAYAPFKFLGDWSVLGPNALFNFDVRVNSGSGLFMQKQYLVKISGSGGTAIIPPDYVEIAGAVNQWKTFSIPVNPAEFTVIGEGASGLVRGKDVMLKSVEIEGKRVENVRGVVLEGSRLSLLGQAYLSRMGEVEMSGDYMVLK